MIGSVFTEDDRWYEMQMQFLHKTTSNFEHLAYCATPKDFTHSRLVLPDDQVKKPRRHIQSLNCLIREFKKSDCELFLILDSDCFPIDKNWQENLLNEMITKKYNVAAIARYENLEFYAHPCCYFFHRSALEDLQFKYNEHKNVYKTYRDVSSNKEEFFPLIRTNKVNDHPLFFGVYWNSFFHHGAGSRQKKFRGMKYHPKKTHYKKDIFNKLKEDPETCLARYTGYDLNLR